METVQEKLPGGVEAIRGRVETLRRQIPEIGRQRNLQRFETLLNGIADQSSSWDEFRQFLESEVAGLVLTAHPTFSLSEEATRLIDSMLRGDGAPVTPDHLRRLSAPTLDEELAQSEKCARHIRRAIRSLNRVAIQVAAARFPDHWREISPNFCTVASWVGFDLDGRTDISWEISLRFRYRAALAGLEELESLAQFLELTGDSYDPLVKGLRTFRDCFELGLETLGSIGSDRSGLSRLNHLAMDRRAEKNRAIEAINRSLDDLLVSDLTMDDLMTVALLRAEWRSLGLGLSHIHFRLNAVQLHNAIRSEIRMEQAPDRSATRRHYLAEISRLLDEVTSVNVHYGDVAREGTTAKRLFMLAAQFEKHFDRHTPIRLLVAESDTPFTLLTALYYARLFGVEDHLELSPLFETSSGLAKGDRVISELLDNPHFASYVRSQGRFCVQVGFSDSGRYIGQPAATLAIERFKLRLIQLWKDRGFGDIQLVFFDTHGESIGRGAHPASLPNRFRYVHSSMTREAALGLERPHKHEISFQGGDGYLWFQTAEDTLAVLTEFLISRLGNTGDKTSEDQLYVRSDWALDFFLTLKEYQDRIVAHPGYIRLIEAFGPGLLYPTGSRAVVRQGSGKVSRLDAITQLRAIPHNAILQQMGYMANVLGGVGTAIARFPEVFEDVLPRSERLQDIMSLIAEAEERCDMGVMCQYAALLDPAAWLKMAEETESPRSRAAAMRLSRVIERTFDHEAIGAVTRLLRRDALRLASAAPQYVSDDRGKMNDTLRHLHGLRLERLRSLYLGAMEIPRFSSRTDISLDDLVERILRLDVPAAIERLKAIFPASLQQDEDTGFGEISTYTGNVGGYADLHREILDPIGRLHEEILECSAQIGLAIGAIG